MKAYLSDFVYDDKNHLFIHPQNEVIIYSDGLENEASIFAVLQGCKDRSCFSQELRNSISDWPSEYHLSWERHNLLRHFKFRESDKILELGSGCGAITRQLGETGAFVVGVEGTFSRAKSAALRCHDLPNVQIYASNFLEIDFISDFDYVFMIGVFEYCPQFSIFTDPIKSCLDIVKGAVKPDGKFVLAIENRLGLKYFAGFGEDHIGIPFYGIQDLYKSNSIQTFGKGELISILKENGFTSLEFQYPFPDYKLPKVILMDRAFESPTFRPSEIVKTLGSRDYSGKTKPHFSEELVWPVLEENKLIADLANSFLVICSLTEDKISNSNILAIHYTVDRNLQYNTIKEFKENSDDSISVYTRLFFDMAKQDEFFVQELNCEAYYQGKNLESEINKKIISNDFSGYVTNIRQWIDFVIKNGLSQKNEMDINKSIVKPDFIDCLPKNIIKNKIELYYFDREWSYYKEFSLGCLLLRYYKDNNQSEFINRYLPGEKDWKTKIIRHLGLEMSDEFEIEFKEVDNYISQLVYPIPNINSPKVAIFNMLFNKIKILLQRLIN